MYPLKPSDLNYSVLLSTNKESLPKKKLDPICEQAKIIEERKDENTPPIEKNRISKQQQQNLKRKKVPKPTDIFSKEISNQAEKEKKSEGYYECTKIEKDPLTNGYLYTFTTKQQYRNLDKKGTKKAEKEHFKAFFPAIQESPDKLNIDKNIFCLGYEISNTEDVLSFTLPDEKTIMARWQILYPDVPIINVVSEEGIASDTSFIQAFIDGKMILSVDKEFLHDHIIHLAPQLSCIIKSLEIDKKNHDILATAYLKSMNVMRNVTKNVKLHIDLLEEQLKNTDKSIIPKVLNTKLGILIDTFSTHWEEFCEEDFINNLRHQDDEDEIDFDDQEWGSYYSKQYGKDVDYTYVNKTFNLIMDSLEYSSEDMGELKREYLAR